MKIKNIRIKNFLSYGQDEEFSLDFEDLSEVTIIRGENGAGKSSILKALTWGLYGKIDGFTNKNIGNVYYPKAEVWLDLQVNSKTISIHRKLSPSKLEVKINGQVLDLPAKVKIQEELEKEIKMPYQIFSNYVAINSTNFKSILSMTPKDRRSIFELILGFDEINQFRDFVHQENSKFNITLKECQNKSNYIQENIKASESQIKLKERNLLDLMKSNEIQDTLELEKINELELEKEKISESVIKLITKKELTNKAIEDIKKVAKDLIELKCSSCGRFYEDKSEDDLEIMKTKKEKIKLDLSELIETKSKCEAFGGNLTSKLYSINSEISKYENHNKKVVDNTENFNRNVEILKSSLNTHQELLIEHQDKLSENENILKTLLKKDEMYKESKSILGDTGFKKLLIRNTIPVLNDLINQYRDYFDLDFSFSFNEELKCDIVRYDTVLSGRSLSKGESEKSDLMVILSLIEIIKTKNPNFNVLFFDEMFGGLSPTSEEKAIKLVRTISSKLDIKSLIVTHHEYSLSDSYSSITVEKVNGFSKLKKLE